MVVNVGFVHLVWSCQCIHCYVISHSQLNLKWKRHFMVRDFTRKNFNIYLLLKVICVDVLDIVLFLIVTESSVKIVLVVMVAKAVIARYKINYLIFQYRLHQVSATTACDSDLDPTQEVIFPPELKVRINY